MLFIKFIFSLCILYNGGGKVEMKNKIIGVLACTLVIIATVIPVAGTMNIKIENVSSENGSETQSEYFSVDLLKPSGKERTPAEITFDPLSAKPIYKLDLAGNTNYEFITKPTAIMTSYYDYMPGSYESYPIRLQTGNGDGQYLTWFAKASKNVNRLQYWAYVDNSGAIQDWGPITSYDMWQGYGGIDIHPATGDCIATWHEDNNGDGTYETAITYDDYDATDTPGAWKKPYIKESSSGNEFIWPHIEIGPSPQGDGYVRVYQLAKNSKENPAGYPCEDVRLLYADVQNSNGADLKSLLTAATWKSLTVFTSWRAKSCRPFQAFAVDDSTPGKVAFIGHAAWLEGDLGTMPVDEGAFVWESYDYGETWDKANLHSDGPGAALYYVNNPGHFTDAPEQLEVTIGGWHNTAIYDSDGNLHMTFLQQYGWTDDTGSYYLPSFLPQAELVWDGNSFTCHEVSVMPGVDPLSGHTVPWDSENTYPVITWSTYPSGAAAIFQENTQKNAVNKEKGWMAQMWVDGTYCQLAKDGDPNYVDYTKHPLIFIAISLDNGQTWSKPIELTDVHNDKFDFSEQITVYPYLCDEIVDLGDDWGQINMYYFDDNAFGSTVQSSGLDPTGDITYCSIKVKFIESEPPSTPTITGSSNGKPNKEYSFKVKSTDPEGGNLYYYIDWGDNTTTDWDGPHPSATEVTYKHTWTTKAAFTIKVKAKDDNGAESDWGEFAFSTPRAKVMLLNFLERILRIFLRT